MVTIKCIKCGQLDIDEKVVNKDWEHLRDDLWLCDDCVHETGAYRRELYNNGLRVVNADPKEYKGNCFNS